MKEEHTFKFKKTIWMSCLFFLYGFVGNGWITGLAYVFGGGTTFLIWENRKNSKIVWIIIAVFALVALGGAVLLYSIS